MMNKRYLILGDLHCRPIWKDIVAKEGDSCDKIIFLGDYTVPREVKFDDPTDACGFLYEVLDFKDKNHDKVVLLRGNHCLDSLGYYWAECNPKDHPKVQQYWRTEDVKQWFLNDTQWIYQIPDTNIVCSHAGIGEKFLSYVQRYLDNNMGFYNPFEDKEGFSKFEKNLWTISNINSIEPCELFAFNGDYFDTRGESDTQPCTWIRPYTLLKCGVPGITQVVGHTPIEHICNMKEQMILLREQYDITENEEEIQNYSDIWCCDCLANREYLIIEDGNFRTSRI